jgi:hypothetical protein
VCGCGDRCLGEGGGEASFQDARGFFWGGVTRDCVPGWYETPRWGLGSGGDWELSRCVVGTVFWELLFGYWDLFGNWSVGISLASRLGLVLGNRDCSGGLFCTVLKL